MLADTPCFGPVHLIFVGLNFSVRIHDDRAQHDRVSDATRAQSDECGFYATARAMAHCDQRPERASTRWSMSASECNGEGVMRRRSVLRGTVG